METSHTVIGEAEVLGEIRAEMARQKLRHRDLAEALGVTATTITMKLNGRRPTTLVEILKIASKLGIDVVHLFGGYRD